MSKEQVSGSLTLSLGGLADQVATEVVTRLASTLSELTPVPMSIVGTIRLLVGYGVPHEQAQGIAQALAAEGRAIALVPFPERPHLQHRDEVSQEPVARQMGPAETFFREGV